MVPGGWIYYWVTCAIVAYLFLPPLEEDDREPLELLRAGELLLDGVLLAGLAELREGVLLAGLAELLGGVLLAGLAELLGGVLLAGLVVLLEGEVLLEGLVVVLEGCCLGGL